MANVTRSTDQGAFGLVPVLEAGDRLDQPTFHARYQQMPSGFRAELIRGVVVVPSPLSQQHARYHAHVVRWLGEYEMHTPGVAVYDNATVILGPDSELQPDACLVIKPDHGGSSQTDPRGYVVGPPELVVEVASSSESYDLHDKLREYQRAGVAEYLVVVIRDRQLRAFQLDHDSYRQQSLNRDQLWHSRAFPGLCLHAQALLELDGKRVSHATGQGLATAAHHAFVEELKKRTNRG